jgi:transposase InsO family protein
MVKEPVIETLVGEQAATLFAGDENEFDFPKEFPLSYAEIQLRQSEDDYILQKLAEKDTPYEEQSFPFGDKEFKLITKENKIVIPEVLQLKAVQYYHLTLCHPGEKRTEATLAQHYTWKGMQKTVEKVCKRCATCQLNKPTLRRVGHLPPKVVEETPWERLCIDLIGPYQIQGIRKGSPERKLHCLTMIDPVTGWFEIAEISAKTADVIINVLEQKWLVRYPRPTEVICDRGKEFMAEVRDTLHNDYGITRKPITTRNPQANSMVERAHQTLHQMFATMRLGMDDNAQDTWDGIIAAVGFAMRATVHSTMRATPMQLVFGRDAIHNVRFQADWQFIKERRQRMIVQNNQRENAKRKPHNYQVGDLVKLEQYQNRAYGKTRFTGPYEIHRVNDNGTVVLRQETANGGAVLQTWNIRKIHPYTQD